MVVEPDGDAADAEPPATVPCGCRVKVYRVPSAVFASVTGLFTLSVNVGEPFAYEPPTTATRATDPESDTSWNSGFAAGKFPPEVTDSLTPFTEITADVGGAVGGAGGVFGGFPLVPPPEDVPPFEPGPLEWNGSLLSKSENDCSWPESAGGCTAFTRFAERAPVADAAGAAAPPSVGAAGSADGVAAAGAGVTDAVVSAATCGFDAALLLFIAIIVCTAYAIASASTTPRPITIFFCFSAFALAASATFFRATSTLLLAD